MAQYTFSFGLADGVRDHMATVTNRIHTMLETLHNDVSNSLADWDSDARNAYNDAKRVWDDASARMPAALGGAEQALASISDGYLRVEHHGVDLWQT